MTFVRKGERKERKGETMSGGRFPKASNMKSVCVKERPCQAEGRPRKNFPIPMAVIFLPRPSWQYLCSATPCFAVRASRSVSSHGWADKHFQHIFHPETAPWSHDHRTARHPHHPSADLRPCRGLYTAALVHGSCAAATRPSGNLHGGHLPLTRGSVSLRTGGEVSAHGSPWLTSSPR